MDHTAVMFLLLFHEGRCRHNLYPPVIISFSVRADLCQGLADVSAGCSCLFLEIDVPGPSAWMGRAQRCGWAVHLHPCEAQAGPPICAGQTSQTQRPLSTLPSALPNICLDQDGNFWLAEGERRPSAVRGWLEERGTQGLRQQALGSLEP